MPTTPIITCPKLPDFDATNLGAVMEMFHRSPASVMRQSWLVEPEADFAPATVWTGWRNDTLWVFAELEDTDIFTEATKPNERLWELGDTMEIFLRPADQTAYSEFQVAPNNQQLQLRFANTEASKDAQKKNSFANALVHSISFKSKTWVRSGSDCWHVLTEIPAAVVQDSPAPLPGLRWHFSFSRYDYTRGRPQPVISSTSAHSQPDFHRQAEWGTMQFQ